MPPALAQLRPLLTLDEIGALIHVASGARPQATPAPIGIEESSFRAVDLA